MDNGELWERFAQSRPRASAGPPSLWPVLNPPSGCCRCRVLILRKNFPAQRCARMRIDALVAARITDAPALARPDSAPRFARPAIGLSWANN